MSASKPQSSLLHPGLGFRVRDVGTRPAPEIIAGFREHATPEISDLMNRLYSMESEIHQITDLGLRLIGPAVTVKVFPGDNLMVHKALDIAKPGDVVVVDSSSSTMNAVLGDLISAKARHRGIAGFVVDGLVRDVPGIRALGDFPVFARGITPIGPLQRGPGELNYPVSVGGIVVQSGDLIVGDVDGVVVIPQLDAADLLDRLIERAAREHDYVAAVARGEFSNDWVDALLRAAGCEIPPNCSAADWDR
jgi:regulator of RNase E activity RraA